MAFNEIKTVIITITLQQIDELLAMLFCANLALVHDTPEKWTKKDLVKQAGFFFPEESEGLLLG